MSMPETDLDDCDVVIGTVDSDEYEDIRFYKEDMYDQFGGKRTDAELQVIANLLAANVEYPEYDDGGCVSIERSNFNDCYGDMMADIRSDF